MRRALSPESSSVAHGTRIAHRRRVRFVIVALALSLLGCHHWTHIGRSDGIPRDVPLAVLPVEVTAKTMVTDATREVGLVFAKEVATEIDAHLIGFLVHDGAHARSDARVQVHVAILGVRPVKYGWLPRKACMTALVEVRQDGFVTDSVVTEVYQRHNQDRLGVLAARDIADWVAYRRSSW